MFEANAVVKVSVPGIADENGQHGGAQGEYCPGAVTADGTGGSGRYHLHCNPVL